MSDEIEWTPGFVACLRACAANRELVAEYDRLNGTNLSLTGAPIDVEVDRAASRQESELPGFAAFVYECVYRRLPWVDS